MRSLLKRFQKPTPVKEDETFQTRMPSRTPVSLSPERPLYVIGDIHGQMSLLMEILAKIDAHAQKGRRLNPMLVFIGDMIDRGEESAAVLTRVKLMADNLPGNVACLMGNHERMMLDFLDTPTERGARWLRNGGLQTLASFGVRGMSEGASASDMLDAAYALRSALPEGMEAWLRALPVSYQSGNIACVHAAADPALPIADQADRTLMWGHSGFLQNDRSDDICVIHGHTIVDAPEHHPTRIAVDTGAHYSGRLTAAAIGMDGALDFMQTGS